MAKSTGSPCKFRTDIGERMKNWEIAKMMTRNKLVEEVDILHSIISEVFGKHSNTVLVVLNLWYTEELRQELKNIQNLCRKAEESWSTEDWDKVRDARR